MSDKKEKILAFELPAGITGYEELGFIIKSVITLTQTALITKTEHPELALHTSWDVYNMLTLLKNLLPEDSFELLAKLKENA